MKIEEFQRLGKNVKVIIRKFTENPGKFASVVLQMYWDIEKERDSYKQQRDELINDIAQLRERNAALEKKTQAFDEIKEYTLDKIEMLEIRQDHAPSPSQFEYFRNLLTAFKAIKINIEKLEREE
ncbi:hypothetical protein [Staphylococcus warneri]|uniref:hypothetical protein n=1 Tax=Staphylococcus warneri TaxID=1292 RepID=UPI003F712EE0